MRTGTFILLLLLSALALSATAFQQSTPTSNFLSRSVTRSQSPKVSSGFTLSSAHFSSADDDSSVAATINIGQRVRNRLRKATGFSFTVFRATLRGITGISLTALYASTLAATGLWIRKIMSAVLGIFPSGFRYFLQPFLVMYYTPLIILRSLSNRSIRTPFVSVRVVLASK